MFTRKRIPRRSKIRVDWWMPSPCVLMSSATAPWLPSLFWSEKQQREKKSEECRHVFRSQLGTTSEWDGKTTKTRQNQWRWVVDDGKLLFASRKCFERGLRTALGTQHRPISCRSRSSCAMGTLMILQSQNQPRPKKNQRRWENHRSFKTFFTSFDSSLVPSFVALFIVWCIEILRCKKSHSRLFFMIFAFVFSFAARFFFFLRSLFGKILFNVHEKAMRSDFITAPRIFGQTAEIKSFSSAIKADGLSFSIQIGAMGTLRHALSRLECFRWKISRIS